MLFDIVALLVAVIMPFFSVWCFYQGYKLGRNDKAPEVKMPKSPAARKKEKKKNKEQERKLKNLNILMHNLEVYDGTNVGQKKLEGFNKK